MARAPFRIEELRIRNFRGIDDLVLELPADEHEPGGFAVIAGDNGCGKTSVLEAVLLVLGRRDLLPAGAAPLEEQVRFGAAGFDIAATVRPRESGAGPIVLEANTTILGSPTPRIGLAPRTGGGGLFVSDVPTFPFWKAIGELKPSVEYFSARREPEALGEDPAPREEASSREAHRILDLKRRLRNSYYHSIQSSKGGRMPDGSPFMRLQRFVQRFLGDDHILDVLPVSNNPGADHEVIVRTGDLPADVTSIAMARAAAVDRRDIPLIVPIDRLSSGQVALFAFAGPLVFRDEPADVVVIDELEQHLHVQWQRHMMRALRDLSPESQFIVATHSLEVLDSALSYERFILVREGA